MNIAARMKMAHKLAIVVIALLLFCRAGFYRLLGPAIGWVGQLNLGVITLSFRSDWFDHILYATRAQPEASAILMEDRVITYGMLGDAIASCGQRIAGLNLAPDSLVAVCIENPIRHMTISLALFRLGTRAVSIEAMHTSTGPGYSTILGDTAARGAFGFAAAFTEVTEDWFALDPSLSSTPLPGLTLR